MHTVSDAAELLGVTKAAVWKWIRSGKIKARRAWSIENRRGRHDVWMIPQSEIKKRLEAR